MPKLRTAYSELREDASHETVIYALNGCMSDIAVLKDGQTDTREFIIKLCAIGAAVGAVLSTGPTGVEWLRHILGR